jgi:hypothetical protein
LDSWGLLDETEAEGRDRLIGEAITLIDVHIAEHHQAAQALGLRRNPLKRPPRSPSSDHFVWAVRVLFLGQTGADVARSVEVDLRTVDDDPGIDPKAVTKAVAGIKELVGWPAD